jgi:hypothetical protein
MEDKMKQFNDAMNDVRKAHRLIYSYQQRMLDLIYFIKSKLDFPLFWAEKRFSNDIYKKRNGYLLLPDNMWAWDFLYSYMFEYYLGEINLDNEGICALNVIQYSDTGFFENEDNSRMDINSFAEEEESGSKLLFILEIKPKRKNWIWNINELVMDKQYASLKHECTIIKSDKGNIQVLYSFSLNRFLNEKTSLAALKEFIDYCKENDVVELNLI